MRKLLERFTVRDLVLIAAMSALGIAIKPVVVPLAHVVSTPLMIPGGALAGGLYMMWIVVAFGLTGKHGTTLLVGFVQAILVMITGVSGSHGAMSLISYTMPGLLVDVVFLLLRRGIDSLPLSMLAGMLANLAGTICVNIIFFSLPLIPLLLSLCVAAFSGGVGGVLSWLLLEALGKYGIGRKKS
jgi:ABC-type thiamin/hydroxymethylpyrimidine transport system permease subunit